VVINGIIRLILRKRYLLDRHFRINKLINLMLKTIKIRPTTDKSLIIDKSLI